MQLSEEARELIEANYNEEDVKARRSINKYRDEVARHPGNIRDGYDVGYLKKQVVFKTNHIVIKRVELYIGAFRDCQLVMSDLDQEEIYEDIKGVAKTKYEWNRLLIEPFILDDHREELRKKALINELEQEREMLLVEVESKLTIAKLKMKSEYKNKTSNSENKTLPNEVERTRQQLNDFQKNIIEIIFESMLIDSERKIGERTLCSELEVDDEEIVRSELRKLGGKVVIIGTESSARKIYGLCLIGLLFTSRWREFEQLLILYLGFVQKQLKLDPERSTVKIKDAFEELNLNDEEQRLLTICLYVPNNPFGCLVSKNSPDVLVPRKVVKLRAAKDIGNYFYTQLDESFDKNFPLESEKQTFYSSKKSYIEAANTSSLNLLDEAFNSFEEEVVEQESSLQKISWLHLTDFHLGLKGQRWLYPNVREAFFEDLERYAEEHGLWDLVLFTGDLTQKGAKDEFSKLNEMLSEVWEMFGKLGCNPMLLTIPGNHDLSRPDADDEVIEALRSWNDKPKIREIFWEKENSGYRKIVKEAFINYEEWQETTLLPMVRIGSEHEYKKGLLPGDFSTRIKVNGMQVGVIGINTAFLQLTGEDYKEKLDINVKQLHEACGMDFLNWVKKNDINLLLTHHPPSWFSSRALDHFQGEILGKNNFLFHLYGHMHEGNTQFISRGGGEIKREIQGASLFGLETWGDGSQQRIHGYNSVEINIGDEGGEAIIWPRILRRPKGGHYYMRPDDGHFQENRNDCVNTNFPIKRGKLDVEKIEISQSHFIKKTEIKVIGKEEGEIEQQKKSTNIISIEIEEVLLSVEKIVEAAKIDNEGTIIEPQKCIYRWKLILEMYLEKFVDGLLVIPGHKSSIYFEIPGLIEKTVFNNNGWRFWQPKKEGLIQIVPITNEAQVNGSGKLRINGGVAMELENVDVDEKGYPLFKNLIGEKHVYVGMSLYLAGKGEFVGQSISIPLQKHKCGRLHVGECRG